MVRIVKAPDVRRNELIKSAQELFYAKGFERTSINDIIKAVGVAKGTFYHYFDSKEAILEAVVKSLVEPQLNILREVMADDSLSAIPKWKRAYQLVFNWKVAHRGELLSMLRIVEGDSHRSLQHRISREAVEQMVPFFAKIIRQGVDEGVFDTASAEDSARIVLSIPRAFRDSMADLILNPASYEDPAARAWQKACAIQTAIERVIGAPAGALTLFQQEQITIWFET